MCLFGGRRRRPTSTTRRTTMLTSHVTTAFNGPIQQRLVRLRQLVSSSDKRFMTNFRDPTNSCHCLCLKGSDPIKFHILTVDFRVDTIARSIWWFAINSRHVRRFQVHISTVSAMYVALNLLTTSSIVSILYRNRWELPGKLFLSQKWLSRPRKDRIVGKVHNTVVISLTRH